MKFIDLLVFLMILSVFLLLANSSISTMRKMDNHLSEVRLRAESTEFIHKSFRNACKGKGFNSLNEWQKSCRAMWKLDYIAWADASEFMNVDKGIVFYGKWASEWGQGEVYCRK